MKRLLFIICIIAVTESWSQAIGSKVKFNATDGKEYMGVIKNISDGKYLVKYDGVDFESWLQASQFTVVGNSTNSKTQFRIGEKVEAQDFTGKWYNTEILAITEIGYKVHYEGYSATYDEDLPPPRVRVKTGQATNGVTTPAMNGSLPSIPGTHWAMRIENSTLPTLEFCKRGSWTMGNYRGADEYGKYKVSGNRLTLYTDDGEVFGDFIMKWEGNILTLTDKTRQWKLEFRGKLNDC